MKYLKITIFIVITMFSFSRTYSTTDDSLYLPLSLGNKWFFNTVISGGFPTVYGSFVMAITEERIISGRKYFKCENFWESHDTIWIRFDHQNGYLVKYDSLFNSCNNEVNLFKLNALMGDTISDPCTLNSYNCNLIQDTTFFGVYSQMKTFNITIMNWGIYVRNWHFVKKIGPVFQNSVSGRNITIESRQMIKGAVINGIIYGDTSLIGIYPVSNSNPQYYELFQNFPNPFNPATRIRFQIPQSGFTQLSVYSLLGTEVRNLISQELDAGMYEIDFLSDNLSSGVYFCVLKSGDFTESKRMILIK